MVAGLVTALASADSTPMTMKIWPSADTLPSPVQETRDDLGVYRGVTVPLLTMYPCAKASKPTPALIICAGGGYTLLDYRDHVERVAPVFNKAGICVVGLKYRTAPPSKQPMADALADLKRAMRIVHQHAKEWNIDPDRVGVMGYSAGANMALNLACHFDAGNPGAKDPVERFGCRPNYIAMLCLWPEGREWSYYRLRPDSPPAFMAHTRDDRLAPVGFAEHMKGEFDKLRIAVHLKLWDRGGHGAFTYDDDGPSVPWTDAVLQWMMASKIISDANETAPAR